MRVSIATLVSLVLPLSLITAVPQKAQHDNDDIKKVNVLNSYLENGVQLKRHGHHHHDHACKTCTFQRTVVNKYGSVTSVFYSNQNSAIEKLTIFSNPVIVSTVVVPLTVACGTNAICPTQVVIGGTLTSTIESPGVTETNFIPVIIYTDPTDPSIFNRTVIDLFDVVQTITGTNTSNFVSSTVITVFSTADFILSPTFTQNLKSTFTSLALFVADPLSSTEIITETDYDTIAYTIQSPTATVVVDVYYTITNTDSIFTTVSTMITDIVTSSIATSTFSSISSSTFISSITTTRVYSCLAFSSLTLIYPSLQLCDHDK